MNRRRLLLVGAVLLGVCVSQARAHFLFIYIGPHAEAGRTAEVFFSQYADAGDPQFVGKIAHTKLWVQAKPGEFQPLEVRRETDRLRAFVPPAGSVSVVGFCEYGVLTREVPFLLRYYPKAVAGQPEELNRMQPRPGAAFEIMATFEGEQVHLTVLRDGKPLPGAKLTTVDMDLNNEELVADDQGRATWKPPGPGKYSVYTGSTKKQSGEAGGKAYVEIREFATIAFDWPLGPRPADPEAVSLFQDALSARAQWTDFPGFTGRIHGEVDGRTFAGDVTLSADGKVTLDVDDDTAKGWVTDQLESIAMHRGAGSQGGGGAAPVLRFANTDEQHPLGRLVTVEGGRFAVSYRIKDRQILVVNRHVGPYNMTITVLENDRNPDGQFLPRTYTVQYWDAASAALRRTETVQDRWVRVGAFDLPKEQTQTIASERGLAVRTFTLSEHRLLENN
jgi:hypothetical protein